MKIKRALISVSDKKGLIPFAKGLISFGVEIVSTGGTAKQLKKAGISVLEVAEYTGFPEMFEGRVKTLHPKIHGGLLALRSEKEHMREACEHQISLIDMVVVNLYPFEDVIQKKKVDFQEAIENIDIGGPAMLRSAAKNFQSVAVICNPNRYQPIIEDLRENNGALSSALLFGLAVEAFERTAKYDSIVSGFLRKNLNMEDSGGMPNDLTLQFAKIQDLRYGENPHQQAAFYQDSQQPSGLAGIQQMHGKELSFNNILDLNAAIECVKNFSHPAACIIKHNNPTGVAENKILSKSYQEAWSCDSVSAFGGIIGVNRKIDELTAKAILKSGFMECIIAPGFDPAALKCLTTKKNIRLIKVDFKSVQDNGFDYKKVYGGVLLQKKDTRSLNIKEIRSVTKKKPSKQQIESALFGWNVIKTIKSNAIILVKGSKTVGIGCGQTSRVESVRIAIAKAAEKAKNSILVSDAFIPKTDNVELAAQAGIKVIIQTGGSKADGDVIQTADKFGIAMIMTGVRHFKH